jgi:hypothetical protein
VDWWLTGPGQVRLEHDRALLANHHPKLTIEIVNGRVEANGRLSIEVGETEMRLDYQLRLVFPDNYPRRAPFAFDAGNVFPHDLERHFLSEPSGAFCLWLPTCPQWQSNDPDALLDFIDNHVAQFFVRLYLYEQGFGWVGAQYSHGLSAYMEYAGEAGLGAEQVVSLLLLDLSGWDSPASPCPCRSGLFYGWCHRGWVHSFRLAPRDERDLLSALVYGAVVSGVDWHPWRRS